MPFLASRDGATLHYAEAGAGPPLVLLHGWAMSGRVWRFQAEEFNVGYRVITPDLRGHGASPEPGAGFGLAELAADLVALFARLDLQQVTLVGWSLGAQVALAAFPALRGRLAGLALVAGTPRFTATAGYPHGLDPQEVRGLGLRLRRDFDRTMGEFFRGMFAPDELSREQENRIAREIIMGGRLPVPAVARQALAVLGEADLRDVLAGIDRPVLLVHGTADGICLPGAATFMAERIPAARLRLIAGLGHAPFLSRPAEFNTMLKEFLQEVYGRN